MNDKTDNIVPLRRSDLLSIVSGNAPTDYEQDKARTGFADENVKLEEINRSHAAILDYGGNVRVLYYDKDVITGRTVYKFYTQDQFLFKYCNQSMIVPVGNDKTAAIELGKWWVKHPARRMYQTITYDPEHIEKDRWGAHIKDGKLNLWTGFGVDARKGSWRRLLKHCYTIICKRDSAKFKYLIKWLAWGIQNPGKAAGTAIVIRGRKGTGKSVLGNIMVRIFGQHGSVLANADHLTGKFNAHLDSCSFVFSDEAYYPDNESDGVLKALITEPSLTVEAKYQTPRTVKNTLKVLMCTNYERAVTASVDERRYFVCETDDRYCPSGANKKEGEAYFNKLYEEVRGDGVQAMMYDLVNMELGDFSPIWHMPRTSELDKQIFMGTRNWDRVAYEFLQGGFFPGKPNLRINASELMDYMQRTIPAAKSIRDMKLYTESLEKTGATKKRTSQGYVYVFLQLSEARKRWEQKNGKPPEEWAVNENGSNEWSYRTENSEPEF